MLSHTPLTSSAGRLFDAVSSILGICDVAKYEGQAAVELEKALVRSLKFPSTSPGTSKVESYEFDIKREKDIFIIVPDIVIRNIVKNADVGEE